MTRIAIIDDEPLVARSFAQLLEIRRDQTVQFQSAEEFLSGSDRAFDCLLVDLFLADGMSGFEMIQLLREQKIDLPAVLMSGNIDDAISASKAATHVESLTKPCSRAELYAAIDRASHLQGPR